MRKRYIRLLERIQITVQYLMSIFKLNIQNGVVSMFPRLKPKGCHFHFAKAIFSNKMYCEVKTFTNTDAKTKKKDSGI